MDKFKLNQQKMKIIEILRKINLNMEFKWNNFRNKKQQTFYNSIPNFGLVHAAVLSVIGFIGGLSGAIIGVDFVTFPIRTLLFRFIIILFNTCFQFRINLLSFVFLLFQVLIDSIIKYKCFLKGNCYYFGVSVIVMVTAK